ncbi:hypothetical protein [Devosia sp. SL43]|uniref:hypothetical protein n=1 Tax=Devosia sp. SL43 TaxID=2806348 RepID=UPI001F36ABEF|nr:hypothetical protein [Devosia sp. SL43]UJW86496.1 hypothetical protein IM737_04305 [Devosia sp. SL43]
MTAQEAEDFLRTYRSMLKTWTMAVAGFSNDDSDLLYRQLEADQNVLADIAISYPEKSYSVDLLINSRSRTWAGYAEQRLPRPQNRQS